MPKEEWQEVAQSISADFGGHCLSLKSNSNPSSSSLEWQCGHGHIWRSDLKKVLDGYWCQACLPRRARYSLKNMKELAASRGGECLSPAYVGSLKSLRWKCSEGHEWFAKAPPILKGQWCPFCARERQKIKIEDIIRAAQERGGLFLSKEYTGYRELHLWRCKLGHEWTTRPREILSGHWCPECGGVKRGSIEELHKIAKSHKGLCLSEQYMSAYAPLSWECEHGHRWTATANAIKRGCWCPQCRGGVRKSLVEMQRLAEERGGQCLSKRYTNNKAPMQWRCAQGHEWTARSNDIRTGYWCPICWQLRRNGV